MTVLRVRPLQYGEGLYQVQALGALVTVLATDEGLVLVDTGARRSTPIIRWGLSRLGFRLEDVRGVMLTHTHPDHAGNLADIVRATGAQIAVHREEAGYLSGEVPTPNPFRNRLVAYASRPIMPFFRGGPVDRVEALEEAETPEWAGEAQVVDTPGHTPGSISLYLPERGALIVGDALQYRFRRLSAPDPAVTHDAEQAEESLARLQQLDFDTILFSHFPPLRGNARGALDRLVRKNARKRAGG
jgi:glyoxylase-like metal-dependent hydrolase (beta-lactamase superfamily II)